MSPLHVLHLTSAPRGMGGVERLLVSSIGRTDPHRYTLSYCNLFDEHEGHGTYATELRRRGARTYHVRGNGVLAVPSIVARVARLLRKERIDVLHAHMPHASIIGVLAARLAKVPLLLTRHYYSGDAHEQLRVGSRPWVYALDAQAALRADHVTAVSGAVRDSLVRRGVPPRRISLIHNGVDVSLIPPPAGALPWPESWTGALLVGCVGSFTEWKAQADLVLAMPGLLAARPDARLVLLGEGAELPRVRRLIAELGLQDRIHAPGHHPEPLALMPYFSIYVQPSRYESFGIAVLEAMAASRVVVATRVGGLPEIVVDGATGILCNAGEPDALARALSTLAEAPATAAEMGAAGRRRVEEAFSLDGALRKYEALYRALSMRQHSRLRRGSPGGAAGVSHAASGDRVITSDPVVRSRSDVIHE
jgi:L-malate glycosyltransferase